MTSKIVALDNIEGILWRTQSIVSIISRHFIDLKDKPDHLLSNIVISDLVEQVDENLDYISKRVHDAITKEQEEAPMEESKKAEAVFSD